MECLYKIVSEENWLASQERSSLVLAAEDEAFIHFSTGEQLERIVGKYWADVASFYVLKIDPAKLVGNLVLEANPGGSTRYYHLYEGDIPLVAVLEVTQRVGV